MDTEISILEEKLDNNSDDIDEVLITSQPILSE